jgi:hypothetical protein
MLSDEALIDRLRSRLGSELAPLRPRPDLAERVREQAAEKRAIRRALAHQRRTREENSRRTEPEDPPQQDQEP